MVTPDTIGWDKMKESFPKHGDYELWGKSNNDLIQGDHVFTIDCSSWAKSSKGAGLHLFLDVDSRKIHVHIKWWERETVAALKHSNGSKFEGRFEKTLEVLQSLN